MIEDHQVIRTLSFLSFISILPHLCSIRNLLSIQRDEGKRREADDHHRVRHQFWNLSSSNSINILIYSSLRPPSFAMNILSHLLNSLPGQVKVTRITWFFPLHQRFLIQRKIIKCIIHFFHSISFSHLRKSRFRGSNGFSTTRIVIQEFPSSNESSFKSKETFCDTFVIYFHFHSVKWVNFLLLLFIWSSILVYRTLPLDSSHQLFFIVTKWFLFAGTFFSSQQPKRIREATIMKRERKVIHSLNLQLFSIPLLRSFSSIRSFTFSLLLSLLKPIRKELLSVRCHSRRYPPSFPPFPQTPSVTNTRETNSPFSIITTSFLSLALVVIELSKMSLAPQMEPNMASNNNNWNHWHWTTHSWLESRALSYHSYSFSSSTLLAMECTCSWGLHFAVTLVQIYWPGLT